MRKEPSFLSALQEEVGGHKTAKKKEGEGGTTASLSFFLLLLLAGWLAVLIIYEGKERDTMCVLWLWEMRLLLLVLLLLLLLLLLLRWQKCSHIRRFDGLFLAFPRFFSFCVLFFLTRGSFFSRQREEREVTAVSVMEEKKKNPKWNL